MVSRELSYGRIGKGGGGFRGSGRTFVLWCVRLIVTGNSLRSLLHQESIRRHADVEEIGEHRDRWTPNLIAPNQRNNEYRCSGSGLWWDAGRCGQLRGPCTISIEALRRQFECRACDKRIRSVQQAHDERTPWLEEGVRRA
jgi:hypothetical protein